MKLTADGRARLKECGLRWTGRWRSETGHSLRFEIVGTVRPSGEVICHFRLKDFAGSQPCYVCSPEGMLKARPYLVLRPTRGGRPTRVLLGEGMPWHLGIKHHGFLMNAEDVWFRRRFHSRHFATDPGDYRLSLKFWFYEAGSIRELLDDTRFGIQRYCPGSEGGASGYILYQQWDHARRAQAVEVELDGPTLRIPKRLGPRRLRRKVIDWHAKLDKRGPPRRTDTICWHPDELYEPMIDLDKLSSRAPPRKLLSKVQDSPLLAHRALAKYFRPGDPDTDAILYAFTDDESYFRHLELHYELRRQSFSDPDYEDCLLVGREAISAHYAAALLRDRKYLRPHHRLWSSWEYRPPRWEQHWPDGEPAFQDVRLWFENRHTSDVDISTTNFHTAGAVACWLCGHWFRDSALKELGRRDLMANAIARQEPDGFWTYATDRWAGEEGYHLHAMSEMLPLLDFAGWRSDEEFVGAIQRGLDYNLAHFALGDGSYLGTPWHAPYPEKGNPSRPGYQLAFTLYMIDDLAAAIRWFGRDLCGDLTKSVRWIYRNFPRIVKAPSRGTRHVHGFVIRPLLLLPLMGFHITGDRPESVSVSYQPDEDILFSWP